jgi:pyrimidine deaminase RibD-like protein
VCDSKPSLSLVISLLETDDGSKAGVAMTDEDERFMSEAITLARRCNPIRDGIPKVGAVIAKSGIPLGTGWRGTGAPQDDEHAEYNALAKVAERRSLPGSRVYTTLEPCTRDVRSKPLECCTELILQSHVQKVFIGILDPNQGVRGKGLWELQRHGIEIELFPPSLATEILAFNEKFIRFQQTLGATIQESAGDRPIDLIRQPDGGWSGKFTLVCKCANDPDQNVKLIVQRGGEWWPVSDELSRRGDSREWTADVYFGAEGEHTIHVVKASGSGAVLLSYYQDVVNRNLARLEKLKQRIEEKKLPSDFLKDLPGNYHSIKMGDLPKGLESQAHVQVKVVKKEGRRPG